MVFDGTDMEGVDESVPYPEHFEAFYPQTKAAAEQLVLQANDDTLATVALRPHLIWGPEDNHLVPRILERGARGALRRIGTRECLVDTIYIDNAATAHLQAADRLDIGSVVAGKAYFLSQGEPLPVWEVVNRILDAGGLPPVSRTISPGLAYAAGAVLEKIYTPAAPQGRATHDPLRRPRTVDRPLVRPERRTAGFRLRAAGFFRRGDRAAAGLADGAG